MTSPRIWSGVIFALALAAVGYAQGGPPERGGAPQPRPDSVSAPPGSDQYGACCLPDGSCRFIHPRRCSELSGYFLGPGVPCGPAACATGACCLATGDCVDGVDGAGCTAMGGLYQGNYTSCGTARCPGPFGACCVGQAMCLDQTSAADCAAAGGVFRGPGTVCDFISCTNARGACCVGGQCQPDLLQEDCESQGGIYQGDEVTCTASLCALGACCLGTQCLDDSPAADCANIGGTYLGDGTTCVQFVCGTATGACCVGAGCIDDVTAADCNADGGTYLGDATICTADSCAPLAGTGACCTASGCVPDVTQASCTGMSGVYEGDGTTCDYSPCTVATGACCIQGNCFSDTEQQDCTEAGGVYLGDGSTCPSPYCQPPPTGGCCLADSTCTVTTQFECEQYLGGSYLGDGAPCGACPPPKPMPEIEDDTTKALDPKLVDSPGARIVWRIDIAGNFNVTLDILDGNTVIKTILNNVQRAGQQDYTDTWDGTKTDGSFAQPKKYQIRLAVPGGGTKKADVFVVRVGVTQIVFVDSSNADAVLMSFDRLKGRPGFPGFDPTDAKIDVEWKLKSLDNPDGTRRPESPPRSDYPYQGQGDPKTSADQFNYPCAYPRNTAASPRDLAIEATTASAGQGFNVSAGAPPIRMKSSFNAAENVDNIKAATDYSIESDASILSANVAKTTVNHRFEFFYRHAAGDFRSLGKQLTSHMIFTTYLPSFRPDPATIYGERLYVRMMETSTVAAAGQNTVKKVVDKVFNPGMTNLGLKYGTIPNNACRTVPMVMDAEQAMCGTMAQVFKAMCACQGISTKYIGFNIKDRADRTFVDQAVAGDDRKTPGRYIDTGPDGICNTTATAPNTQLIPVGKGLPKQLAIDPGPDGICQSVPCDTDGDGVADGPCDDELVDNQIFTGKDGICQTKVRAGSDDVQVIDVNKGQANAVCVAPGGYILTQVGDGTYTFTLLEREEKWSAIVIRAAGLNRTVNPWSPMDWKDVFRNYAENPGSFKFLNDNGLTDDVKKVTERRYRFEAPDDGHALVFLEDGGDTYMYDPSFLVGPVKNPYGKTPPNGYKKGDQNAVFRTEYYNGNVDFHEGRVVYNDNGAVGVRLIGTFTVKTTLIPSIPNWELHLSWSEQP